MSGPALTLWTIRLALMCYAVVLAWWLSGRRATPGSERALRIVWTAGCAFFVSHVICAFQFHHHWSNQVAVEETAKQTQELIGWAFGEGIYFSYVFLALWLADVLWWWASERTYLARPTWVGGLIHGYLLFIAFNGAIIFEGGVTRWGGILVLVAYGVILARRVLLPLPLGEGRVEGEVQSTSSSSPAPPPRTPVPSSQP